MRTTLILLAACTVAAAAAAGPTSLEMGRLRGGDGRDVLEDPVVVRGVAPLPGATVMAAGFDVLQWDAARGHVLEFSYLENRTTPDGAYAVPDGFDYSEDTTCSFDGLISVVSTTQELRDTLFVSAEVGASFFGASAAFSSSYRSDLHRIRTSAELVVSSRTECVRFSLARSNMAARLPLAPSFAAAVRALPAVFDPENAAAFFRVFETFGTHVFLGFDMGGVFEYHTYLREAYLMQTSLSNVTAEARLDFIVRAHASSGSGHEASASYLEATSETRIVAHGGAADEVDDWSAWVKSVKSNPDYPVRRGRPALTLTEALASLDPQPDPSFVSQFDRALQAYVFRPGCTDPAALNYNASATEDNGSCEVRRWSCDGTIGQSGDHLTACRFDYVVQSYYSKPWEMTFTAPFDGFWSLNMTVKQWAIGSNSYPAYEVEVDWGSGGWSPPPINYPYSVKCQMCLFMKQGAVYTTRVTSKQSGWPMGLISMNWTISQCEGGQWVPDQGKCSANERE